MKSKLKIIRTLIAKLTPFSIRRLIHINIIQHLYFSGSFIALLYGRPTVKLITKGYQIENEIYWRGFEGCHEGKSMQVFAEILKIIKPKTIWDIGANSGTYGILAKALLPNANVIFFEPIPKAADMVKENIELNNFEARIFQLALGDYDGQGEIFFHKGEDMATSVTVNRNTIPKGQQSDCLRINVKRADTLINENQLNVPSFIKLDVEGYEYEVLKGFGEKDLSECIFLIEILTDDLAKKLNTIFLNTKYDFYNIDDRKKTNRKTEFLEKSDFYNYLIIPKKISLLHTFEFKL
jgi:FkbM family methyltransferase